MTGCLSNEKRDLKSIDFHIETNGCIKISSANLINEEKINNVLEAPEKSDLDNILKLATDGDRDARLAYCWVSLSRRLTNVPQFNKFLNSLGENDGYALYLRGLAFCNSYGVFRDYSKALPLFRKSANYGCAKADIEYALCFYRLSDLANDKMSIIINDHLNKHMNSGNAEATGVIGYFKTKGFYCTRDEIKGMSMIKMSASQGCPFSMREVGIYEAKSMNYLSAKAWLIDSAKKRRPRLPDVTVKYI